MMAECSGRGPSTGPPELCPPPSPLAREVQGIRPQESGGVQHSCTAYPVLQGAGLQSCPQSCALEPFMNWVEHHSASLCPRMSTDMPPKLAQSKKWAGVPWEITFKDVEGGTSLAVQWLRFCTSNARGSGSIPGQKLRSYMLHGGAKICFFIFYFFFLICFFKKVKI